MSSTGFTELTRDLAYLSAHRLFVPVLEEA